MTNASVKMSGKMIYGADEVIYQLKEEIYEMREILFENQKLKDELVNSINQFRTKLAESEAREACMVKALQDSLELDLCHETSCPFPMRAMCNNESHKLRRGALTNTSEQAKALLAIVEVLRANIARLNEVGDADFSLVEDALAAYDKLKGGA